MVAFLETDEAKTRTIMHQRDSTLIGISIKQEFINKLCN